ncbi:hypothetical protein Tco_0028834 [Tanacetum coccineum]
MEDPRPNDVLVFGWVGGKHACVDLTSFSPIVGLSSWGFTVGEVALKVVSPNKHGNSPSHSGSPSATSNGNDGGHFQGADASASE